MNQSGNQSLSLIICLFILVLSASASVKEAIDLETFLSSHDLVWEETPRQWSEGGFVGNGQLGMMIYTDLDHNRIIFHVGRSDVTDHRLAPDRKTSFGTPGANVAVHYPRLDIGWMVLKPKAKIQSVNMRLDLWNAELRGVIHTDHGQLDFRALCPHGENLSVVEVTSADNNSPNHPNAWEWGFLAAQADSPRVMAHGHERYAYESNPLPIFKNISGVEVVEQSLLAGGDYATSWLEVPVSDHTTRLYISTVNEVPESDISAQKAVETVIEASREDFDTIVRRHHEWWHQFYQRSFLSIPDPLLESFYWIQIYKMGSATRPNGPAIDLFGPWFKTSIWPGMWWNLNVQLTYWPLAPANHMDLSQTLNDEIDRHWQELLTHFGGRENMGDMAWVLHNYWLHYRYAGEWEPLVESWLPKVRHVLAEYRAFIYEGEDEKLHLKPMGSPEFMGFKPFNDTNYNLAIIRWLVSAIQILHENTGKGTIELEEWQPIVNNLVDFPVDENGLMIGSDQSFSESHRHFSHMIGFYPLFVMDPNDPETKAILNKSVDHWLSIRNPDGRHNIHGYTLAIAASMQAALGNGERAEKLLQDAINNQLHRTFVFPNTFYAEGAKNVTFETPAAIANATRELVFQSWGNVQRVFSGTPASWADASFHSLRGKGGFLVSAQRKSGKTAWVSIESLAGERLRLSVPDWSGDLAVVSTRDTLVDYKDGYYEIDLKQGERIVLSPMDRPVEQAVLHAVDRPEADANPFGLEAGQQLRRSFDWDVVPMSEKEVEVKRAIRKQKAEEAAQKNVINATWSMDKIETENDEIFVWSESPSSGGGEEEKLVLFKRGDMTSHEKGFLAESMPGLGHALSLNGDDMYANGLSGRQLAHEFEISLWVNPEGSFEENIWILDALPSFWLVIENHGSRLGFHVWDEQGKMHNLKVGFQPSAGWQHITAGYREGIAYVNVADGDSGEMQIPLGLNNKPLTNGLFVGTRSNLSGQFEGQIDEIQITRP